MAANFEKVQRPAHYQSIPILVSIHMYINRNRKEVYLKFSFPLSILNNKWSYFSYFNHNLS